MVSRSFEELIKDAPSERRGATEQEVKRENIYQKRGEYSRPSVLLYHKKGGITNG